MKKNPPGSALEAIGCYLVAAKFVCGDNFVKPVKLMRTLFIRGGGISYKMIITQERLILSALDWNLYTQWNEICDQLDAADVLNASKSDATSSQISQAAEKATSLETV